MNEIIELLNNMFKIEFDVEIENVYDELNIEIYIEFNNNKFIIKNMNKEIEIIELIEIYVDIIDYNIIEQFQYLYQHNEYELIEFIYNQ